MDTRACSGCILELLGRVFVAIVACQVHGEGWQAMAARQQQGLGRFGEDGDDVDAGTFAVYLHQFCCVKCWICTSSFSLS